jgi:hypothetical protein
MVANSRYKGKQQMNRKYTKSGDGIERCSVNVEIRLSRESVQVLENFAKENGQTLAKLLYQISQGAVSEFASDLGVED